MTEEELRLALLTGPFQPVRLHLSDGSNVEVHSPGAIIISRRTTGVVVNSGIQMIANMHITKVEPLELADSKRA
jgi:hypothetical protein